MRGDEEKELQLLSCYYRDALVAGNNISSTNIELETTRHAFIIIDFTQSHNFDAQTTYIKMFTNTKYNFYESGALLGRQWCILVIGHCLALAKEFTNH